MKWDEALLIVWIVTMCLVTGFVLGYIKGEHDSPQRFEVEFVSSSHCTLTGEHQTPDGNQIRVFVCEEE